MYSLLGIGISVLVIVLGWIVDELSRRFEFLDIIPLYGLCVLLLGIYVGIKLGVW